MNDKYDKYGKTISLAEWSVLMGDGEYKRVAETTLPDGKWISTVWLGLDHSFGEGKPLVFETMVFPSKGNYCDLDMQRYFTLEEAKEGHEVMVKKYFLSN
jgi:hypothetical protein